MAGQGWVRAKDLQPGDPLVGHDERITPLTSITRTEQTRTVYNLRVSEDHTYFVGSTKWGFSIWVHNAYGVKQLADGTFGIIDDAKDVIHVIDQGGNTHRSFAKAEVASAWATHLNGGKVDWGKYLTALIGPKPPGMKSPHAHHILFKEGLGEAQKYLVQKGQDILRKVGIDPVMGPEMLCWAPRYAKGQHGPDALKRVVTELEKLDRAGGDYNDFVTLLKRLGKEAAERK